MNTECWSIGVLEYGCGRALWLHQNSAPKQLYGPGRLAGISAGQVRL